MRIRHGARSARSNLSLRRRSAGGGAIGVRAEVSFVDGDEAKRLVAEEGYTVLDIRDRTQRERAHIKNSAHVPLFVENDDGDIGNTNTPLLSLSLSSVLVFYFFYFKRPNYVDSDK